jgi:DNA-directed RNA polymerase specialized sigma24 family protein
MNVYDVDVHREGGYWVGVARGVRGGATEVRRLARFEPEVRDLLSGLLDVDPEAFQLRLHYRLSGNTNKRLREYQDARQAMDAARQRYEQAQRSIVTELRTEDVSLRDSAELLGVSFQRVQQLTHS